jgi:uncharacterized protein (TIGR00369 family)
MSDPNSNPPNPNLDAATAMATEVPQAAALGFQMVSAVDGRGVMHAPWREDLVGDPDTGVIASGVVTSLLDHCCGMAITATTGERKPTATLDLRIDYMRPAEPGKDLFARAHCYKVTRSVAFVRAVAYDDNPDDPVAAAQAAFMLDSSSSRGFGANLKDRKPRK